jgi:NTP pyrophosphatase (non-canonical NTP hydrolase)
MEIKELIKQSHENAVKHGFWDAYNALHTFKNDEFNYLDTYGGETEKAFISQFLMLIVSEVAEAEEALRHNDEDNFTEEISDIIIRTCDLAGGLDIDLEAEIQKKMEINKNRPYKHGKEF